MKVLLIGGACQGKAAYAKHAWPALPLPAGAQSLHRPVRDALEAGEDPQARILAALEGLEDWLLLCDEVGSGVVPVDALDRQWREAVGRLCCELARRADVVERITCGIPQRIKG